MRLSILLRAGLPAVAAVLAACSSTPPAQQPPAPSAPAPAASAAPAAPAPVMPPTQTTPAHLDPDSPISKNKSVFFEFDSSTVPTSAASVIDLQGTYLVRNPALHVRVEGNTDERGGSEYNLALGQRRAEAVKKALVIYGVKDAQIEAVSFGKEKPKATGHDEASWAQNRRADIAYPTTR